MEVNVFDLVEFEHHVSNAGIFKGRAIYMYDIDKNEYFYFIVDDEYDYYQASTRKYGEVRPHRKIEATDEQKRLLIQRAKYVSLLRVMKSRFFKDTRETLENIWKSANKNKKNLLGNVLQEYTDRLANGSRTSDNYAFVVVWILTYTKYTKVSADEPFGVEGVTKRFSEIIESEEEYKYDMAN